MTCFLPFNNKDLVMSLLVFRPTVVLVDDFVEALKRFSVSTETLGCAQSSIFKSIHGNMIIWYGVWKKTSIENNEHLITKLAKMLSNTSTMANLVDHSFFDAYAGESRDGSSTAKFSTGDTILMHMLVLPNSDNLNNLSYANLALFRSRFPNMEGALSGVCLKCQNMSCVACFFVWESLQCCYSWILVNSDYKRKMLSYLESFPLSTKYDIFWVIYVNSENLPKL